MHIPRLDDVLSNRQSAPASENKYVHCIAVQCSAVRANYTPKKSLMVVDVAQKAEQIAPVG